MTFQSLALFICLLLSCITVTNASGSVTVLDLKLSPSISSSNLSLQITGTHEGYIGFGFGTNMVEVDMILIYFNGVTVVSQDCYSTSTTQPPQDYTLADGHENTTVTGSYTNGEWSITLTRPLIATDSKYDTAIITSGTMKFAVVLGSSMDISIQHSQVKVFDMNFSDASASDLSGSLLTFSIQLAFLAFLIFLIV